MPVSGFKVSGGLLDSLPLATRRQRAEDQLNYFPRAVMIASATFLGASE